jgi:hypothetical protein
MRPEYLTYMGIHITVFWDVTTSSLVIGTNVSKETVASGSSDALVPIYHTQCHISEDSDTNDIIIIPPATFHNGDNLAAKTSPFSSVLLQTLHLCLGPLFHTQDLHSNKTRCHLPPLSYNYTEAAKSLPTSHSAIVDTAKCIL